MASDTENGRQSVQSIFSLQDYRDCCWRCSSSLVCFLNITMAVIKWTECGFNIIMICWLLWQVEEERCDRTTGDNTALHSNNLIKSRFINK